MAQATMVMCGFSGQANALKKQPLLLSQINKIKPDSAISRLFFSPLPLHQGSSTKEGTTAALLLLFFLYAYAVKPKKQVEDGIFGTSGGIGFTKQNELFVGRVAMIGFAVRKGILSQLNIETGIPIYEAEPLLLFFILFTLLGAIGALGDRGQFIDDPPTGLEKAVIPPGKGIKSALGLKEGGPLFGFTKSNELFVGRLAQLGFVFSLIGEIITGKGALAQLNIETGVPIGEIEPLVLFNVAFFFFAALNPGTGKFITDEDED
ncbi:hypothetical protein V2J09_008713 [Rumex salicifolius]